MKKINSDNIKTAVSEKKYGKERPVVYIPNSYTKAAMEELKSGKGKYFISVDELFKSI
ncbi:MAG: hypothetical protein V4577_05445 [Bacteroidota bacterium]